jgi:RNA polymerase sigma-70 factor, ECF subfamily
MSNLTEELSDPLTQRDAEEATLLLRLQQGDKAALQLLYDALSRPVFSLAFAMLKHREEAEEVVQDSFMKLYKEAYRFDSARGSVRSFLYTIARNYCLSRLRAKKVRPQPDGRDPHEAGSTISVPAADLVTGIVLRDVLEELGEPDKTLLQKVYFEGFSHRELSKSMDMPLGTIKSRIRRALLQLRERLGGV